jgi:hypothetical protein
MSGYPRTFREPLSTAIRDANTKLDDAGLQRLTKSQQDRLWSRERSPPMSLRRGLAGYGAIIVFTA